MRHSNLHQVGAVLCLAVIVAACGRNTAPTSPTSSDPLVVAGNSSPVPSPGGSSGPFAVGAPQPVSPADDESLATRPAELVVDNATSHENGVRIYDFEVSQTPDFAATVIAPSGIPEGPSRTSYAIDQDLEIGRRYYWRARARVHTTGPWSGARSFIAVQPGANTPPRIVAIVPSVARAEVDTDVTLSAVIADSETPASQLSYEWNSPKGGTIMGTGPTVVWRAAKGAKTPITYEIVLTVTEQYTATNADGREEILENKAFGSVKVHLTDSITEVANLTRTFLRDFSDSRVSADVCVRNFSDTCPGKALEHSDITYNRNTRVILSSVYSVDRVFLDPSLLSADVVATCDFTSRVLVDVRENGRLIPAGTIEHVDGICTFSAVYHTNRWWLCDSHFQGSSTTGAMFGLR